ncbi:hypothetical protein C2G38_2228232 [Gigaspora rosea]|uniref:Uncharacterized protein n=1 Tax=Gigaspora rosea TaxID=44941 RepID=A0A397TWP0_9GLOM|nr:hypothetical protein C2G38_2228232 [Gigaspora rosea]
MVTAAERRVEKQEYKKNFYVDGGNLIDFNIDPSEVRIYSFDPDVNKVVWDPKKDPVEVKSRVLEGSKQIVKGLNKMT